MIAVVCMENVSNLFLPMKKIMGILSMKPLKNMVYNPWKKLSIFEFLRYFLGKETK